MGWKDNWIGRAIGRGMTTYNAEIDVRKVRERGGALGQKTLLKMYRTGTELEPWPEKELMFSGCYVSDGKGMRRVEAKRVDSIVKMHLRTFFKLSLGEDEWGLPYGIRDAYFNHEIREFPANRDKVRMPIEPKIKLIEELFEHVRPELERLFVKAGIDLREVVRRGRK